MRHRASGLMGGQDPPTREGVGLRQLEWVQPGAHSDVHSRQTPSLPRALMWDYRFLVVGTLC